jgi:membrane fusion protein, multidrug efflux system
MPMANNLLKKYFLPQYIKYLKYLAVTIFVYLLYIFYVWCNTQSSDNAYLDIEISNVSPEVSGTIKTILVSDNVKVKKGDIIAEINDEEYKTNFAKALADVQAGSTNVQIIEQKILIEQINLEKNKEIVNLTKTNLDITEIDYKRTVDLNKDNFASKKLLDVAKIALEKVKSEYIQAKLNLQINEQNLLLLDMQKSAARAALESLEQTLNLAKRNLGLTKIISPVDGVLTNSGLRLGGFVRPGMVVFSIVPSDIAHIKANFKETQITKFKENMVVEIRIDSIPNKKFYGKIRNLSPATGAKFSLFPPDNASGNFTKIVQRVPVLIDFVSNSDIKEFKLFPGLSARVSVRTDQ